MAAETSSEEELLGKLSTKLHQAALALRDAGLLAARLDRPTLNFQAAVDLLVAMDRCCTPAGMHNFLRPYSRLNPAEEVDAHLVRAVKRKLTPVERRDIWVRSGEKGGASDSPRKKLASAINGRKGGRPKGKKAENTPVG